MFLLSNLSKPTTYLACLICVTAFIGDYVVSYSKLHVFQALFDNVTHFLIGGLSWSIVCLHSRDVSSTGKILEIFTCSLLSSLIDLDHFIEAKSLNLMDATNLKRRPFLHCSTFPLLVCILFFISSYLLESFVLKRCSLILLTAFASHHTRDATRRGYWFYPFGSTVPVPYLLYIGISCISPFFIKFINEYFNIMGSRSKHLDMTVI